MPNCQSSLFMSQLCMWSFDLRHKRHLVDGWPCFDYNLQIPNHGFSKILYVGYDMKYSKMKPLVFKEIDSRNEM